MGLASEVTLNVEQDISKLVQSELMGAVESVEFRGRRGLPA
jgi:hypothetical protein